MLPVTFYKPEVKMLSINEGGGPYNFSVDWGTGFVYAYANRRRFHTTLGLKGAPSAEAFEKLRQTFPPITTTSPVHLAFACLRELGI